MRLAVIPARGGSQRIPRKNIRHFCGRPVIEYSIRAALDSGLFDAVIVSTDDEEIGAVALESGAEVPFLRPAELADHHSVIAQVMKHAVDWVDTEMQKVDYACCIYATAPMMQIDYLKRGFELVKQGELGFVLSVTEFEFPIQRALQMDALGRVSMVDAEYALTRSQDLPTRYHDAAQFIWGSGAAFRGEPGEHHTGGIVIPRRYVQDIDNEEDWVVAEMMYQALTQMNQKNDGPVSSGLSCGGVAGEGISGEGDAGEGISDKGARRDG